MVRKCSRSFSRLGKSSGVQMAEHGRVEAHHLLHLIARPQRLAGDVAQELRQPSELLRVGATPRVVGQPVGRVADVPRAAHVL